jgi:hypothetical protein
MKRISVGMLCAVSIAGAQQPGQLQQQLQELKQQYAETTRALEQRIAALERRFAILSGSIPIFSTAPWGFLLTSARKFPSAAFS